MDGTTACVSCIREVVYGRRYDALDMWARILDALPTDEMKWLADTCNMGGFIFPDDGEELLILRLVVSKALRMGCTPEEILREIGKTRSARCLML